MSAIGLNVSTKDNDYTPWTALYKKSKKQSTLEQELRDARIEMDRLRDEYITQCDYVENLKEQHYGEVGYNDYASHLQLALDGYFERYAQLEHEVHWLYKLINCAHTFEDFPDGNGDVYLVCTKCGLRD
jgi:hypothetical protein